MSENIITNPPCPLITSYTREVGIPDDTLQRLYKVRSWQIEGGEPIPFKWPSRLREILPTGEALRLREYQKQAAHSLARMMRFILGDAVGLGKTLSSIAASCWLFDRLPRLKIIVMATKSVTYQWASEFEAFSTLRPYVMTDTFTTPLGMKLKGHQARLMQMQLFLADDEHDVLVCKYSGMIGRRKKIEKGFDEEGNPVRAGKETISQEVKDFREAMKPFKSQIILILDEAQKAKTVGSSIRIMVEVLQGVSGRTWALTATALKNTLDEFYSIAAAIGIRPFGKMHQFYEHFCIFRSMPIGKGREIQKLEGYRNVAEFKNGMRPFFLGRSQRQVKEPLPQLVTQIHSIELDEKQRKLLLEDIPNGTFVLPPSLIKYKGEFIEKERDPDNLMTAMSVMQLVANHPALIDPANEKEFFTKSLSPKEERLLDLLDGDLKGEKVIVFSKFKMHIDRLERITKQGHFTDRKFLRITGDENAAKREVAKQLFQDPTGNHDLVFINTAAIEGVNLQQASHMVCLDVPWSFGDMMQLVGRMVRMASPHSMCTLHILAAEGTVDIYALDVLRSKKKLFELILGASQTAGLLDDRDSFDLQGGMETVATDAEFHSLLKAHVKSVSMKGFVDGSQLEGVPGAEGRAVKQKRKFQPPRKSDDDFEDLIKRWS